MSKICTYAKNIKEKISCAVTENTVKSVLVLAGIYFLGIISIIRANYKYIDDFGRVIGGYKGWDDFSRYTSVLLSPFVHADNYLTDISPIPQIIAVILLAVAGIITVSALINNGSNGTGKISILHILAVVPMGLSPYFLECLSYKYDSPYMALSVLAAVIPVVMINESAIIFGIASAVGTIIMLTTYQASSGIFPMLIVMMSVMAWNKKAEIKNIIQKAGIAAAGYIVGMGIYKFLIMKEVDEYVSSSVAPFNEIIAQFIAYYRQVIADFKTWWLLIIAIIIAMYVVNFIRFSEQNKIVACAVAVISVMVCLLLAFGMYPVLSKASTYPRAMYGFGAMIAIIGVCGVGPKRSYISGFFSIALAWTFLIFSVSYGNCLYEQAKYADFRIESVIDDLKDIDMMIDDEETLVQISGTIGDSPVIRNIPQGSYMILERLVPQIFEQDWKWSTFYFYNYFDINNIVQDRTVDLHEDNLPIIKDTMYHTIYGDNHKILIELKQAE